MSQQPITNQDLLRIHGLCKHATAEPLAIIGRKRGRVVLYQTSGAAEDVVVVAMYYGPHRLANASLAAAANRDMRRLLAEIKRLRAILAQHGISYK
jgi:hypothetical protein